jgi:O-antigen ligase
MPRLVETALIVGVVIAVLAFGGTEPASFAVVQVLLLGVAALVVASSRESLGITASPRSYVIPAVLTGIVLLQLCPLPAHLFQQLTGRENPAPGSPLSLSFEPYSTQTHLLILLTCFVAFYFAQIVSADRDRKRRLIVSLLTLGTLEAFYGLVQYLSGWQRIFLYAKKYDLEEATGTYINRNHYAGFLEMVLPFSLALLFYEYSKLRGTHSLSTADLKRLLTHQGVQRLVLWLAVAVVLFTALFFSRSRMGIVAACASLLVFFGLAGASRFQGKMGFLLSTGFIVLSIGLAVWIGPGPIVSRFAEVQQEFTAHDQSRLSIWQDAQALVRNHPLIGTGLGTFPIAFTAVQTTFLGQFVNHAHNDYLELAIDLGLPAAIILFASILWTLARTFRTFLLGQGHFDRCIALGCVGSIVAILLHSMTDFNLYIPANAVLFAVVLGIATSNQRTNSRLRSDVLDA